MKRWWIPVLVLIALLAQMGPAMGSGPAVHAFLDRTHVTLGDTVTLNLQSDGTLGTPDLAPLQNDFRILGTSRSTSVAIVNGKAARTAQLGVALKPLHSGTLTIPSLAVGGARTQPLTLVVGAAATGGSGKVGDPAFMETDVLSSAPYVDAQTVYTVRLFYLPGVNGTLGDPNADGARLIRLDRDQRYMVDRDGYSYGVLERSWALIPERDGSITVQGPVFAGQQPTAGNLGNLLNNPNALLNNPGALLNQMAGNGTPVRAQAPAITIDARAQPAGAGKPWLPAHSVQLKLTGLPADGQVHAGTPWTLTLSVSASGQPAGALPEPQLPRIAGARVYPDQTQDSTDDSGEWLQGTHTRSFAIMPDRNGALTIPAITLNWWNLDAGHAEQARVPAHTLQVTGVPAPTPAAPAAPAASTSVATAPAASRLAAPAATTVQVAGAARWRELALASLVLWLLAIVAALVGWWRYRTRRGFAQRRVAAAGVDAGAAARLRDDVPRAGIDDAGMPRALAGTAAPAHAVATRPDPPRTLQKRALDAAAAGDAVACEHALLAWAQSRDPETRNLGALRDHLADAAQRDALDALQRARWQGGDAGPACTAVASAFARGFAWRRDDVASATRESDLPPLYPS